MPVLSAVTGRPLAASTLAGYAADWSLFTDWCTAVDHRALPADAATISAFQDACPGAPCTQLVRVAAIEHHHRAAGVDIPWKLEGERPVRAHEPLNQVLVATAMRLLPSRGWTTGLFGRRDAAVNVVDKGSRYGDSGEGVRVVEVRQRVGRSRCSWCSPS
jgi:hypothetical protein